MKQNTNLIGGSSGSSSLAVEPVNKRSGKFNHIVPSSDISEASDALDDFLDEALDPLCTCRKADNRPCQPPGLDVCVFSSSMSCAINASFFLLNK